MREGFVPAFRFRRLTAVYDPVVERWMGARRIREAVIGALDLRPGLRLLELGCGPGRLAIAIKRRWPDVAVIGVDVDRDILAVARRNAAAAGIDVQFEQADITAPLELGTFDRVASTLVFHHLSLDGKARALAAAGRVLAPGGRLVIADFGRPRGWTQWLLFSTVAWLDGIANTAPHRDGRFEAALRAAFPAVDSVAAFKTGVGTVEVFVCRP